MPSESWSFPLNFASVRQELDSLNPPFYFVYLQASCQLGFLIWELLRTFDINVCHIKVGDGQVGFMKSKN